MAVFREITDRELAIAKEIRTLPAISDGTPDDI